MRWSRLGVFDRIFAALTGGGPKPERIMIDATHLKAHRTAVLIKGMFPDVCGVEVSSELVIASWDATPVLDAAEGSFNSVPLLVGLAVQGVEALARRVVGRVGSFGIQAASRAHQTA